MLLGCREAGRWSRERMLGSAMLGSDGCQKRQEVARGARRSSGGLGAAHLCRAAPTTSAGRCRATAARATRSAGRRRGHRALRSAAPRPRRTRRAGRRSCLRAVKPPNARSAAVHIIVAAQAAARESKKGAGEGGPCLLCVSLRILRRRGLARARDAKKTVRWRSTSQAPRPAAVIPPAAQAVPFQAPARGVEPGTGGRGWRAWKGYAW